MILGSDILVLSLIAMVGVPILLAILLFLLIKLVGVCTHSLSGRREDESPKTEILKLLTLTELAESCPFVPRCIEDPHEDPQSDD